MRVYNLVLTEREFGLVNDGQTQHNIELSTQLAKSGLTIKERKWLMAEGVSTFKLLLRLSKARGIER